MTADIGRSAMRVYKHYKKHYDDISSLFEMTGLTAASSGSSAASGAIPDDLLGLVARTDLSLEQVKRQIGSVDEIASINPAELRSQKPDFCSALVDYQKDLDVLFAAIQSIRAKAPKPKRRSGGKVRTKKF